MKNSTPIKVIVSNDIQNFHEIWPRSNRLGVASCYAFQCADILELSCSTIIAARKVSPLFAAIIAHDGVPLALIPLCIECHRNTRILTFLDVGLADYNAPVVFPGIRHWDQETISSVWSILRDALPPFDAVIFERMPDHVGDLPNPLTSLFHSSLLGFSGHACTLGGNWEEFKTRLPHRRRFEKIFRQLTKRGPLTFDIATVPEQYDVFLEALIRQKKRRNLETRGVEGFVTPGYVALLRMAKHMLYPKGPVCLFALKVKEIIIATGWGYVVGSRFYYLITSFESGEWRPYSPGRLFIVKTSEWCLSVGLRTFDFGLGDEELKKEYCDILIPLYGASAAFTMKGHLYLFLRNCKLFLRNRKRSLMETKLRNLSIFGLRRVNGQVR
jgi:CelD/BcsL family acetyltransferase involved in cellulose biosynthesis